MFEFSKFSFPYTIKTKWVILFAVFSFVFRLKIMMSGLLYTLALSPGATIAQDQGVRLNPSIFGQKEQKLYNLGVL